MDCVRGAKQGMLSFRGTAHPPAGVSDADVANLSTAEIATTSLAGKPLLYEHNSGVRVGRCDASWEGRNGELRVAGTVTDSRIAADMRRGKTVGLSLGTDVVQDQHGTALYKQQAELSVCADPRRPDCFVDVIDGRRVRTRRRHSAGNHGHR